MVLSSTMVEITANSVEKKYNQLFDGTGSGLGVLTANSLRNILPRSFAAVTLVSSNVWSQNHKKAFFALKQLSAYFETSTSSDTDA